MSQTIDSTDNLTHGFSEEGMEALDESLNQLMYEDVCDALDNLKQDVIDSLENCWQGVSKDKFLDDLEERIEDIKDEIEEEYEDLQARFSDLSDFYKQQDEELYTGI